MGGPREAWRPRRAPGGPPPCSRFQGTALKVQPSDLRSARPGSSAPPGAARRARRRVRSSASALPGCPSSTGAASRFPGGRAASCPVSRPSCRVGAAAVFCCRPSNGYTGGFHCGSRPLSAGLRLEPPTPDPAASPGPICISHATNSVKPLFMCSIAMRVFSRVKCLFVFFVHGVSDLLLRF